MVETEYALGKGVGLVFLSSSDLPRMERLRKRKGRRAEGVKKVRPKSTRGKRNIVYKKMFTTEGSYAWSSNDSPRHQNGEPVTGATIRSLMDDRAREALLQIGRPDSSEQI